MMFPRILIVFLFVLVCIQISIVYIFFTSNNNRSTAHTDRSNQKIRGNNQQTNHTQASCPPLIHQQSNNDNNDIRIAFFIRGTKTASALIRLLDTLYLPQHYYLVHLDVNTPRNQHLKLHTHLQQQYPTATNIFTFAHPYAVHYMSFDLLFLDVRAVLFFLHLAGHTAHTNDPLDAKKITFDYFINLSAQEYPLVGLNQLNQLLLHYKGTNFVEIWCSYEDAPKYKQNRIDEQWFHGKRVRVEGTTVTSDKPANVHFHYGSFYVVLTKQFLVSLFFDSTMLNVLTYLRYTRVPDESFFATAIMNSKEYKCTHFNSNLRYVNWGRATAFDPVKCVGTTQQTERIYGAKYLKGGSHPCILGMLDVEFILQNRKLRTERGELERKKGTVAPPWFVFGNKFDVRVDALSVQRMQRQNLHSWKKIAWDELVLAQRTVPNRLHCPIYNGKGS